MVDAVRLAWRHWSPALPLQLARRAVNVTLVLQPVALAAPSVLSPGAVRLPMRGPPRSGCSFPARPRVNAATPQLPRVAEPWKPCRTQGTEPVCRPPRRRFAASSDSAGMET
jgi:hypothetical protein